jgi:hypothetical protein
MIGFLLAPELARRLEDEVVGRREEGVFFSGRRGRVIRYFLRRKVGLRVRAAKGGLSFGRG